MKSVFKAIVTLLVAGCAVQMGMADTAVDASKKSSGSVSLQGVVTARAVLSDSEGIFFLQDASGGVGVKYSGKAAELPKTGSEIKLTAEATAKSFLNYSGMELVSTNATLPKLTVVRDATKTADAVGKYAVIPAVKFEGGKFKGGDKIKVSAKGKDLKAIVSKPLDGRDIPTYAFNFFGVIANNDILGGDGSDQILVPSKIVPTAATETRKFATANTCFTCHQADTKLVGPAYLWVAAKYKDDPEGVPKMVQQIRDGGMGKWGPIPMIGFKGRLQDAQMEELSSWIYEMRWQVILND